MAVENHLFVEEDGHPQGKALHFHDYIRDCDPVVPLNPSASSSASSSNRPEFRRRVSVFSGEAHRDISRRQGFGPDRVGKSTKRVYTIFVGSYCALFSKADRVMHSKWVFCCS